MLVYSTYERHYSHILEKAQELLRRVDEQYLHGEKALLSISGSAGMGLADSCGVPFVQEVFSTRVAVKRFQPGTDCVIELGGEDAKILFLTGGTEVRMNGSCAGGTGAFIDQMATLLKMSAQEMNTAAEQAQRTYTIASRCGVFAKSDVQPLINQGARTEDIAASIYKAVVNQTIAGLAQGRPIRGNVLYLGGPLTFSSVLRKSFDEALGVTGLCPENSLLYVSLGAALYADQEFCLADVAKALDQYAATATYASEPPLFANQEEYEAFHARHLSHSVPHVPFAAQCGPVHIGIDSGSTTVKLVVVDSQKRILYTNYQPNLGNPLPLIREQLLKLYKGHPGLQVVSVTTTGYGEDLVKNAFRCDYGLVETVAHFTAAKYFMPDVDFIIDIGGQDMKCFKIEDGAISNIFLNEACSSGCGSFLQTFAQALGYDVKKFAALGLFADRPVDLGSRCTVFMNSSVKQAQKDGASLENISAGLSISVVKNALYKVIRASSPEELGRKIVVQGGTFYNEAVLRAFEKEMGVEVIRPDIAGLMGAYGAALYGMRQSAASNRTASGVMSLEELEKFDQKVASVKCGGCGNHCQLTINTFADGRRFVSGNRCDKPVTGKGEDDSLNLYAYKQELLASYRPIPGSRGSIGIPMCLNFYELLPFWHAFWTKLGFAVHTSPVSSRGLYLAGQATSQIQPPGEQRPPAFPGKPGLRGQLPGAAGLFAVLHLQPGRGLGAVWRQAPDEAGLGPSAALAGRHRTCHAQGADGIVGFYAPGPFTELVEKPKGVISLGAKMGEGWLLTAEMIELVQGGYSNIVCAQPFGCLPNHIVGKGMVNKIRALYPSANITPIDYDPSATRVNQENRIKLMLAVARERLNEPAEAAPLTAEQLAGGAPELHHQDTVR